MTMTTEQTRPTDAEVKAAMAEADGILGAAGHQLGDPYLRDLAVKMAHGELSTDEGVQETLRYLDRQ